MDRSAAAKYPILLLHGVGSDRLSIPSREVSHEKR